jgi:outer membrane biosynthesis protein TonB
MSIQVLYQSLSIAKEPRFRLQDGGLFIELDSPMPVATALSVHAGEHSLQGKVRRVKEGAGAGMLVVPVEATKLPRWLLGLGAEVGAGVEFEPEPAPPPPPVVEVKPEPVVEVKPEPVVEVKPEPVVEAKAEPVVEVKPAEAPVEAAPSKQTPAEAAASGEDEDESSEKPKAGEKKTAAKTAAKKKKPRR